LLVTANSVTGVLLLVTANRVTGVLLLVISNCDRGQIENDTDKLLYTCYLGYRR
jgi:hypothetical protein